VLEPVLLVLVPALLVLVPALLVLALGPVLVPVLLVPVLLALEQALRVLVPVLVLLGPLHLSSPTLGTPWQPRLTTNPTNMPTGSTMPT